MPKGKKQNKQNKQNTKQCKSLYLECNVCVSPEEHFKHWDNCNTWVDLLIHMKKYLKGEYLETPSHYGPLQEKDPLYKEKLIKLNELGIITDSGQEYEQIEQMNSVYMQREYLIFGFKMTDESHLANLLDKFQNADFYFEAFAFDTVQPNKYFISNGLEPIGFESSEFWVSRTFNRKTKEYENHTHLLCNEDMPYILDEFCNILSTLQDNLVIVEVWTKTWDLPQNGKYLLDKVIECFQQ
jgi:hypothetical protein